ncbi:hypothetical protein Tco_0064424 [Tanacetum coccineum]
MNQRLTISSRCKTETINIKLEHSVAKLLVENEQLHKEKEHLKQTYKDLFDSIKRTRVQTIDQNDSLMAQLNKKSNENADVLAQIQKKGFAIAALKNELRKLTEKISVKTCMFAKPNNLGKTDVGTTLKNQSVVRQPTAFKSERPRISKPRFASQVDVNNDLSKPVTTHHLPKRRESAPAKPHHMIATKLIWVPTWAGKKFSPLHQQRLTVKPTQMFTNADIPNQCKANKLLNVSAGTPLKYRPVLMLPNERVVSNQFSLILHQMTSAHNRSELGIHDHSNEQSSSKLVPKVGSLSKQDSYITTRLGLLSTSYRKCRKTKQLSCLLKEQLLEPALNLTVHCCGREFRVLNGYDQKSI